MHLNSHNLWNNDWCELILLPNAEFRVVCADQEVTSRVCGISTLFTLGRRYPVNQNNENNAVLVFTVYY